MEKLIARSSSVSEGGRGSAGERGEGRPPQRGSSGGTASHPPSMGRQVSPIGNLPEVSFEAGKRNHTVTAGARQRAVTAPSNAHRQSDMAGPGQEVMGGAVGLGGEVLARVDGQEVPAEGGEGSGSGKHPFMRRRAASDFIRRRGSVHAFETTEEDMLEGDSGEGGSGGGS